MDKKIEISEDYLIAAIEESFKSLVGESMKRFEILSNVEDIKREVKELTYEKKRELIAVIRAFDCGVKFVSPRQAKK